MFGLSARHFNRYQQIGWLLYKYGRSDLVRESGLLAKVGKIDDPPTGDSARPEDLANDLEQLGPAFVKLGQLLSTRPDFLPTPYLEALTRLQDDVETVEWKDIAKTIEEELGADPKTIFKEFDEKPLASASIGQVHRATMRDGREVVVKIQRPGIAEPLSDDVQAFKELATFLEDRTDFGKQYQLVRTIDSLEQALKRELNYVAEAQNAIVLRENLKEHDRIVIPEPITDLTTCRVLTMEYIPGSKITDLSEAVLIELDRHAIADDIFAAYLQQVLVDGVFHADPHPGNLALASDHKIVLMDFGLVVRVAPTMRSRMVKLVLALADGDGEMAARLAEEMGEPLKSFDQSAFRRTVTRIVSENVGSTVEQMSVGSTMMELQKTAGQNGMCLPDELTLLGKTLMNLDRVVMVLAPDFDPNQAIRDHAASIMNKHGESKVSLTTMYQSLIESAEFAQELPMRANRLLRMATENEFRLKVDSIDEDNLIQGLHKIANRITAGLIVAALLVSASLIMRLQTSWTILGYPALATIFFLVAAFAGIYLWWRAVFVDDYK